MSASPDDPPPYCIVDDDEILAPATLALVDRTITEQSDPSAPLYSLSHSISTLTHATTHVSLARVEPNGATPHAHHRHIFDIVRPRNGSIRSAFVRHYYAHAVSSHALGHIGLKKGRFLGPTLFALELQNVTRNARDCRLTAPPRFVSDAAPLFKVDGNRWFDAEGNDVAMEGKDEAITLDVTARMKRQLRDALVALWACRLCQESAAHAPKVSEGLAGVRRKIHNGEGYSTGWVI